MEITSDRLLVEGTRDELLAELRRLEEGWDHLGKPAKAAEARQGYHDLMTGSSSVRVGHTVYDVTETPDTGTLV
jgi:hypothetical protein